MLSNKQYDWVSLPSHSTEHPYSTRFKSAYLRISWAALRPTPESVGLNQECIRITRETSKSHRLASLNWFLENMIQKNIFSKPPDLVWKKSDFDQEPLLVKNVHENDCLMLRQQCQGLIHKKILVVVICTMHHNKGLPRNASATKSTYCNKMLFEEWGKMIHLREK